MTHGRSLAPSTGGQVHLHSGKHQCKLEAGHKGPAAALDNTALEERQRVHHTYTVPVRSKCKRNCTVFKHLKVFIIVY